MIGTPQTTLATQAGSGRPGSGDATDVPGTSPR